MNKSNELSFPTAAWSILGPDFRAALQKWWAYVLSSLASLAVAAAALWKFGTPGSMGDMFWERAFILVGAGLFWPLLVMSWSVLRLPWRLYCNQQKQLTALSNKISQAAQSRSQSDPLEKERLEVERLKLVQQATEGAAKDRILEQVKAEIRDYAKTSPKIPKGDGSAASLQEWINAFRPIIALSLKPDVVQGFFNRMSGAYGTRANNLEEWQGLMTGFWLGLRTGDLKD